MVGIAWVGKLGDVTANLFPGKSCSHSATVVGRNCGSTAIPRLTA